MFGDLARVLVREVEGFERELVFFPDDASVWRTLPGVTNSAGTLALHIAGNLQYYVGGVLGGSGYIRDRTAEFSRRDVPRAELLDGLRAAKRTVESTLSALPAERLHQIYPEDVIGMRMPTGRFLLHLATHAAHHLGQVGYLRRIVTGQSRSSGAIPMKALADE
jgi:uncharacterized damage-inducible protein DinB